MHAITVLAMEFRQIGISDSMGYCLINEDSGKFNHGTRRS